MEGGPILLSTAHRYRPLSPPMTGLKSSWEEVLLVCTESLSSTFTSLPLTVQVTLGIGRPPNKQERLRLLPVCSVGKGLADTSSRMSAGSALRVRYNYSVHHLNYLLCYTHSIYLGPESGKEMNFIQMNNCERSVTQKTNA